jgi:ribosome-binding factor A
MSYKTGEQSQRQRRVGEQLRKILAQELQTGLSGGDIFIDRPITVSEVRVSPDLKRATAYAMPLGGKDQEEILSALNELSGQLQSEIGRQTRLKFTPKLDFELDQTFDRAEKMEKIFNKIPTEMPGNSADKTAEESQ